MAQIKVAKKATIKHTVGTRITSETYINQTTGEVMTVPVIMKEISKDLGWHKVWLMDLAYTLGLLNNARVDVLAWVLKNVKPDNTVIMTQSMVAKDTGISRTTVNFVMHVLQEGDVLKMIHRGAYFVNPNIIAKGSAKKRGDLMIRYTEISDGDDGEKKKAEKQPEPQVKDHKKAA